MTSPNQSPEPQLSKRELYKNPDQKPVVIAPSLDAIPEQMRSGKRWVLWRLVWKAANGKWDKQPFQPNGKSAKSNDPKTWSDFDTVVAAYKAGDFDGIGYMLANPIVGCDFDNVRSVETGELTPEAAALVDRFATYCEVSPSGTGVKLFGRGEWKASWHKKPFGEGSEVEVYSSGRFFTVTGKPVKDYPVSDIQQALDEIAERFGSKKKKKESARLVTAIDVELDEDDNVLIERAKRSKNGSKFASLWDGSTAGHGGDESRADMALCMYLAFWTGRNPARMDRLFRQSGLMRGKWDENRGEQTYGQRTIAKAIEEQTDTYNPTLRVVISNDSVKGIDPEQNKNSGSQSSTTTDDEREGNDEFADEPTDSESTPKKTTPQESSAIQNLTESLYASVYGQTWICNSRDDEATNSRTVTPHIKLANFTAKIIGETITDDGMEQSREYTVEAIQGRRPAVADIPVDQFESLDWVISRLGARFIISAAKNARNHLRCAIQEMSCRDLPLTTVYAHTGWVEIEGRWHYLHAGGAVSGPSETSANPIIKTRLHGAPAKYCLPVPPRGEQLKDAVRASLELLGGVVCGSIAFPLLATTYRSVLGGTDSSLWIIGLRGTYKSELAALAQQHFGAQMKRLNLPGNWSSTENALESLAFTLKDALFVVDDFAPTSSRVDSDQQKRSASRVLRAAGNSSGRQRLDRNRNHLPEKAPRGLILSTGEDIPTIPSIQSRLGIVEIEKGDVKLPRLSRCQKHAKEGLYAASMAGFLSWLAPQYGQIKNNLEDERIKLRDEYVGKYSNTRTPDLVANLLLGLKYFLDFAESIQAVSSVKIDELRAAGELAFQSLGKKQKTHHDAVDPVERFPGMIASILSSGRGYLADRKGQKPAIPNLESVGWKLYATSYEAKGQKIGWIREKEIYLDQNITFALLKELAENQGVDLSITPQTLWMRLKQANLLLRTEDEKTTHRVTIEGHLRPVMVFSTPKLLGEDSPEPSEHRGASHEAVYPCLSPCWPPAFLDNRYREVDKYP